MSLVEKVKVEKRKPLVLRDVDILGFEPVKLNSQNQIIIPEKFIKIFLLRQQAKKPNEIILYSLKNEINNGYKKRMLLFDDLGPIKKETIPGEDIYYYINQIEITKGHRITLTGAGKYFNSQQLYLTGVIDSIEVTDFDPRK